MSMRHLEGLNNDKDTEHAIEKIMMSVDHGVGIKDEIVVCVLENPRKIFNPLMRGGNKRSYGQSGRNRMAFENGQS